MRQNQTLKHVQRQSISKLVTLAAAASLLLLTLITFHILQFILVPSAHGMVQKLNTSESETSAKLYQNSDIISTRGHFDYHLAGQLIQSHNTTDYAYSNDFTSNSGNKVFNKFTCPPGKEIAIYIHGAWTDEQAANEQFNRTAMSLISNNYTIPLIGFSWDSNTPLNKSGWETAKNIAEMNGPKLAQFVIDFKNKCKN
ncbi:MAG: hypothetical protein ACRD8Z_11630, partial [Nitrososphaeraceae archaeon]